jgi:hypothetical protein
MAHPFKDRAVQPRPCWGMILISLVTARADTTGQVDTFVNSPLEAAIRHARPGNPANLMDFDLIWPRSPGAE